MRWKPTFFLFSPRRQELREGPRSFPREMLASAVLDAVAAVVAGGADATDAAVVDAESDDYQVLFGESLAVDPNLD